MERSADWMDQANGDLAHARHDVEAEFYEWACFSAQQSAEKAVKAVFLRQGMAAWGHSVRDLLNGLEAHVPPIPKAVFEGALELDKAYIPARYPDAHPSGAPRRLYTKTEANRLVEHAEQIVRFCEGLLSAT